MHARKQRALAALMASPTVKGAAEAAGVSERTMYRYMDDEEFAEAYREAMRRAADETAARLVRSMLPAVNALDEIAQDGRASPHARVAAANSILSHGMRSIERRTIDTTGPVPTFCYGRDEASAPTLYLGVEPRRRGQPAQISDEAREDVARLLDGTADGEPKARAYPHHTLEDADRIHALLRERREGKRQGTERKEDGQEEG